MRAAGLGQATALALQRAGLTVVAVDRSEAGLNQLPDEIHREVADATDPAVPGPLVNRIAAEVGPPDILVNTIGAFEVGDALSVTAQSLRQLIEVNLGAALWLTQAVVPHMQEKGSGAIVHIAARPGVEPTAGYAAYGVSKAALVHLVRTLDVELRPHGIRVNAVAPQIIATAKNKAMFPPGHARQRCRTRGHRRRDRLSGQRRRQLGERSGRANIWRMSATSGAQTRDPISPSRQDNRDVVTEMIDTKSALKAPGSFALGQRQVNRIGYGAMQLAGDNVFGPPRDREEALRVLRTAIDSGINHIDTAQYYGPGVVNELIRRRYILTPPTWRLVSKVAARRDDAGAVLPYDKPDQLRAGIEENLMTLGLERLAAVNLRIMDGSRPGKRFDAQLAALIEARARRIDRRDRAQQHIQ